LKNLITQSLLCCRTELIDGRLSQGRQMIHASWAILRTQA
jgi:hypothetical protein